MAFLITGSSGFIGTNFCKFLIDRNIKFVAVDKIKNRYINISKFYKVDLKNFKKLLEIVEKNNITKILHLAALPGIKNCHDNPDQAFKDNILVTYNIIKLLSCSKVKRILIASSFAVDSFYRHPSIYSSTKKFCEDLAFSYFKNLQKQISILKFSNVFGPYSLHKTSAIHSFIKNSIKNKSLLVHGNGMQTRDFIFVEDLIKKIFIIFNSKKLKFKYSIHTGKKISINRILKFINEVSGKNNKKMYINTPGGYDIKQGKELFNKIYLKKILKCLKITFKWYKSSI